MARKIEPTLLEDKRPNRPYTTYRESDAIIDVYPEDNRYNVPMQYQQPVPYAPSRMQTASNWMWAILAVVGLGLFGANALMDKMANMNKELMTGFQQVIAALPTQPQQPVIIQAPPQPAPQAATVVTTVPVEADEQLVLSRRQFSCNAAVTIDGKPECINYTRR